MAIGALSSILPVLGIGSKLLTGGGGQAAAAGAPAPGPFDAISQAPPQIRPPMPEQNPAFHDVPGGDGGGPARPMMAQANNMPLPQRNPREEMFPGIQPPMPEKNPALHDVPGGDGGGLFNMQPTMAKTAPINSADTRTNAERYSDAGWTLESSPGVSVPKGSKPGKPAAPVKTPPKEAVIPDDEGYDAAPTSSAGKVTGKTSAVTDDNDEPDAGDLAGNDDYSSGGGLFAQIFGPEAGGAFGDLQDRLGESATNPMFQAGMGMLAGGWDGTNPYLAMQRGLSAIPGHQIAAQNADLAVNADARAGSKEARDQAEEQRQAMQLAALVEMLNKYKSEGAQEPGSAIARGSAKIIR